MNKTTNIIIAVAAVAVIAVGAVLLFGNKDDNTGSNNTNTSEQANSDSTERTDVEVAATITYTDDGFSPSRVTVPAGSAVRIVNESDSAVAPSSDNHPTHTLNPELNFPDIDPGQSATMVVSQTGTWGIHNHYKDDHRATIIVE